MTSLLPKERSAIVESIHQTIAGLRGHADERHHLLNILGHATAAIHEAKAVTTMDLLQKHIALLASEVEALRKQVSQ